MIFLYSEISPTQQIKMDVESFGIAINGVSAQTNTLTIDTVNDLTQQQKNDLDLYLFQLGYKR